MPAYRYNLAWVDEAQAFGPSVVRNDEDVFSWRLTQSEGDFATLEVEIINPRVGLIAPGRPRWVWFSASRTKESASEFEEPAFGFGMGATLRHEVDIPLFKGRIVGVPEDVANDIVKLTFIARPSDFESQKIGVAAEKAVVPYYDPIWFAPDDANDPDNVLEFRPELWHTDRVTHEVSTSNILNGEDGTVVLTEDNVLADSVRVNFGAPPVSRVNVVATVTWNQVASGDVDISQALNTQWGCIVTYTGDKLLENWPKPGARIGAGWKFGNTYIKRVNAPRSERVPAMGYVNSPYTWNGIQTNIDNFDVLQLEQPVWTFDIEESRFPIIQRTLGGFIRLVPYAARGHYTGFGNIYIPPHSFWVPKWTLQQRTYASYEASRGRTETLSFSLPADMQDVVTDPAGAEVLDLTFASSEITSPVDPGGAMPLGKPSNAVYFSSTRGTQSVESLLMMARAQILARARCVNVEAECPFDFGIESGLSLRKNAVLYDYQLPGGVAAGKITEYTLSLHGDSGVASCEITFACTVGRGGAVASEPGEPTYCADGYVDGYQRREGEFVMPVPGEITYKSIEGLLPNDDGIDFDRMTMGTCVRSVRVTNTYPTQEAAMRAPLALVPGDVIEALNKVPTTWELNMVPIGSGPFQTNFDLETSDLKIPKTIDLGAAS